MNRRRFVILLLVVLGILSFAFFHESEPRYQGRTLTEWIAYSQEMNPGAQITSGWVKEGEDGPWLSPQWQKSSHAVKQMAPDAIPLLLKWVQVNPSPIENKLAGWLEKIPGLHFHFSSLEAQSRAFQGFCLLRNAAKPAWPKLIALTYDKDPERRWWALNCLVYSRPDKETLEPVLRRLIHDAGTNVHFNVQYFAAWAFHDGYSQDAEAAGVYKMFPKLKNVGQLTSVHNQPAPSQINETPPPHQHRGCRDCARRVGLRHLPRQRTALSGADAL